MAVSGSIDFSINRDELITEALELSGRLRIGATPTAAQITSAARTLNMMVKAWQADGIQLHEVVRTYLFTDDVVTDYVLDGTIRVDGRYGLELYQTTVTSDAAAATTSIAVPGGITGDLSVGDYFGVYNANGGMDWYQVTGGDGLVLDIGPTILSTNIEAGALLWGYTNIAGRPLEVLDAYVRDVNGNDRPINLISRMEYAELTLKNQASEVVSAWYDAQVGNTPSVFRVWPKWSDPRNVIVLWVRRTLDDFDAGADTPDFPQEFYLPLAWCLAREIADKFGCPAATYQRVNARAEYWYEKVRDYAGKPEASVYFQPSEEGR